MALERKPVKMAVSKPARLVGAEAARHQVDGRQRLVRPLPPVRVLGGAARRRLVAVLLAHVVQHLRQV